MYKNQFKFRICTFNFLEQETFLNDQKAFFSIQDHYSCHHAVDSTAIEWHRMIFKHIHKISLPQFPLAEFPLPLLHPLNSLLLDSVSNFFRIQSRPPAVSRFQSLYIHCYIAFQWRSQNKIDTDDWWLMVDMRTCIFLAFPWNDVHSAPTRLYIRRQEKIPPLTPCQTILCSQLALQCAKKTR